MKCDLCCPRKAVFVVFFTAAKKVRCLKQDFEVVEVELRCACVYPNKLSIDKCRDKKTQPKLRLMS